MKPKPASSIQPATPRGSRSIRAPSASNRSAEPDALVAERLPCLATAHPAPAATSAALVDTLKVRRPPPVPAVSSRSEPVIGTCAASSRIVRAIPASSSTVSPLVRSAIRNAAIWISETSPCMISASTSALSSVLRSRREASASIARVRIWLGMSDSSEEVGEQLLALFGEHRLGVELHALGRQLSVAQRHQHTAAVRGRLQAVGQALVDDQRVVATHCQRRAEALEDRAPVVLDRRCLAVHRLVESHGSPERLRERLVAEADAERGDARFWQSPRDFERDARLVRRARSRRDHAAPVSTVEQLLNTRAIVAHRPYLTTQLAEILDEVVRKGVVIVDHEHAHRSAVGCAGGAHAQPACRHASSTALITAEDFATDSSYSYAGLASATVPPPACTWATPSLTTTVRMWIAVSRSPV